MKSRACQIAVPCREISNRALLLEINWRDSLSLKSHTLVWDGLGKVSKEAMPA